MTFEEAKNKYTFTRIMRGTYVRVLEVPQDEKGEGALFAISAPKGGYVSMDMYTTYGCVAQPGIINLNCRAKDADGFVRKVLGDAVK